MASPAQALWHVSQVVQSLGHAFGSHVPPSLPEQGLLQLSLATFEARDMMLHPFAHTRESLLFQTAVLDKFGVRYTCPPQQAVLTSPGTSAVVDLARETNKRKAADTNGPVHTCHTTPAISPTGGLEFFANKPRNAIIVEQSHPSGHSSLQHLGPMTQTRHSRGSLPHGMARRLKQQRLRICPPHPMQTELRTSNINSCKKNCFI